LELAWQTRGLGGQSCWIIIAWLIIANTTFAFTVWNNTLCSLNGQIKHSEQPLMRSWHNTNLITDYLLPI
jgi:hypothetical protein